MTEALAVREVYCPAHFGNTYEVAQRNEMAGILSEAKFWGFNRYSDWFDTADLYDLYAKTHHHFNMPEAMWDKKFSHFTTAAELGLELGLVVTPNHVFSDQVTEANQAVEGPKVFGQLVCPSKPGVVELVLRNYRNLFGDFARRGLRLAAIGGGAYDYGGCLCEKCQPWIVTFGRLFREVVKVGREFFPGVQAELWAWWWTDEDHRAFSAWADREAPGEFASVAFHLPYGRDAYDLRPIPKGSSERAFVHISYGEASGQDAYGHYGPPIAPRRLERTVAFLRSRRAAGYLAYSEGVYDEINKAVLAGLSSGRFASADDVLRAYAERHLGGDAAGWAEFMAALGDFFTIDIAKARRLYDRLASSARPSWRLAQLAERLNLAEADAAVRARTEWDADRLAAARAFLDAKERLYRPIWGLGLGRHIFQFEGKMPPWYSEYLTVCRPLARRAQADFHPEG